MKLRGATRPVIRPGKTRRASRIGELLIGLVRASERPTTRMGMTLSTSPAAIAIRRGEHACCQFDRREDREYIADAFMRVGLRLGHRVVYLCRSSDVNATVTRLESAEPDVGSALRTGACLLYTSDAADE